jgi:hypothetical protein
MDVEPLVVDHLDSELPLAPETILAIQAEGLVDTDSPLAVDVAAAVPLGSPVVVGLDSPVAVGLDSPAAGSGIEVEVDPPDNEVEVSSLGIEVEVYLPDTEVVAALPGTEVDLDSDVEVVLEVVDNHFVVESRQGLGLDAPGQDSLTESFYILLPASGLLGPHHSQFAPVHSDRDDGDDACLVLLLSSSQLLVQPI